MPILSKPTKANQAGFLLAEYSALRSELLKRIEILHQLITLP
jgi:hypothetical protein